MLRVTEKLRERGKASRTLTLPFDQRQKSRLRVQLDDGCDAALLLPRGEPLRGGDQLRAESGEIIEVMAAEEDVSTARSADPTALARACYHLGNRHVPLQITDDWVRYEHDHVLDSMVRQLGLQVRRDRASFEAEGGAYGHTSSGGHGSSPPVRLTRVARTRDTGSLLRILQLASPALPVGAFAHSQGIELAVDRGWVHDEESAREWILGVLSGSVMRVDVPIFARLYHCWSHDSRGLERWSAFLHASRESQELQSEDRRHGASLARLLVDLGHDEAREWISAPQTSFATLFALAACRYEISLVDAAAGLCWTWTENQAAAALKLGPLGQVAGQRILSAAVDVIRTGVTAGLELGDDEIGFSAPRLAIASALHETQYSRLFRS